MTATTNGWPGKPGVPLNPKQNGAHKIGRYFLIWRADTQDYVNHNGNVLPPEVACALPYLGPVLSHDEATALQARVAELEGALATARRHGMEEAAKALIEKYQSMIIRPNTPEAWRISILQDLREMAGEKPNIITAADIDAAANRAALEGKKDE